MKFISGSVSGSFKACLTIHIFLETGRHLLELALVDFLESSCPSLCVGGQEVAVKMRETLALF